MVAEPLDTVSSEKKSPGWSHLNSVQSQKSTNPVLGEKKRGERDLSRKYNILEIQSYQVISNTDDENLNKHSFMSQKCWACRILWNISGPCQLSHLKFFKNYYTFGNVSVT